MVGVFFIGGYLSFMIFYDTFCDGEADAKAAGIGSRFICPVKAIEEPAKLNAVYIRVGCFQQK